MGLQRVLRPLPPGERPGRAALLLVYNLWTLFVRLLEPGRHVEAAGSRRWFLVIAARLVESGRQKTLQLSAQGRWWEQLKAGYTRVAGWLASTAPQLKIPPPLPVPIPPPQLKGGPNVVS
jgi:hypothetical protein